MIVDLGNLNPKLKLTDLETIFGGAPLGRKTYAPEACNKHESDI